LDTWSIPSESRPGVNYLVRRIYDILEEVG